jgi:hypothetical protein
VISEINQEKMEMGVHDTSKYPAIRQMLGMHEDEPFFIFRAQDKNSPAILLLYETSCKASGCEPEIMRRIAVAREEFQVWQAAHAHVVKVPD